MIEIRHITKRFGQQVAVNDLSFDVHPGRVTGFLGPNGSGKSTTMRCMLGLDRFERGTTTFDGKPYAELDTETLAGLVAQVVTDAEGADVVADEWLSTLA